MSAITQWAALIAALIHIAVAVLEMFLFERPWVRRVPTGPHRARRRLQAVGLRVGSHNVVAGLGPILGLIILRTGNGELAEALVSGWLRLHVSRRHHHGCGGRLGLYPRKGDSVRGDIGAGLPP